MKLGADGVQIASRFVATEECDASDAYKQAYIQAEKKNIPAAVGKGHPHFAVQQIRRNSIGLVAVIVF